MRGTNQVDAVSIKKLALLPVQSHRHMAALVEEGMRHTLMADDKSRRRLAVPNDREAQALAAILQISRYMIPPTRPATNNSNTTGNSSTCLTSQIDSAMASEAAR